MSNELITWVKQLDKRMERLETAEVQLAGRNVPGRFHVTGPDAEFSIENRNSGATLTSFPGGTGNRWVLYSLDGMLRLWSDYDRVVFDINSFGDILMGLAVTPTYQLQLKFDSAAKPGSNVWTVLSDVRVKEEIQPYAEGLAIVRLLQPVRFRYQEGKGLPTDKQYVGFLAQDLERVAPSMVERKQVRLPQAQAEPVSEEPLALGQLPRIAPIPVPLMEEQLFTNTGELQFTLINAIKELDSSMRALEQRLTQVERRLPALPL